MIDRLSFSAISAITEPEKIRVVIFINNELVHVPLPALVKHLTDKIEALEARVEALEGN